MSSRFEHGHKTHQDYALLTEHSIGEMKLDPKKFYPGDIVAVNASGALDPSVKVYDISLTRNVVQMLLALIVFVWIMLRIAKRYKTGVGVTSAPKGSKVYWSRLSLLFGMKLQNPTWVINMKSICLTFLPFSFLF